MKKWIAFGAVMAVLLAGGGWWFWSLGSIPAPAQRTIALSVEGGLVEIRRVGSGSWIAASDGTQLTSGDAIRTGSDGTATIRFSGLGESRLGTNSELTIQTSIATQTNLRLSAGRVWTRLLRLLDLDSSFSVRTNSVSATVRGTAFDVQMDEKGSAVLASESVVDVAPPNTPSGAVPFPVVEGFAAQFDAQGRMLKQDAIGDDVARSSWFAENTKRDRAFAAQEHAAIDRDLASLGGPEPESAGDAVTKLSEQLHLSVAGNAAPDLAARYAVRRMYRIARLIDAQKTGLAYQAMSRLETEVQRRLSGPSGPASRAALRAAFRGLTRWFEIVEPGSPAYRLRQRFEDLVVSASVETDAPQLAISAKLDGVQSELLSADAAIGNADATTSRGLLDAAAQGSDAAAQDIAALPKHVPNDEASALKDKLAALRAFAAALEKRLSAVGLPLPSAGNLPANGATTSTPAAAATTTATIPTPPKPKPSQPTASGSPIARIVLSAAPNPASLNENVRLTVTGFHADGSSADLTGLARLERFGNLGVLNGPTFVSAVAGSVTVTATISDSGKTLTSSVAVEVKAAPRALKSIALVPGTATIAAGGAVTFQVIATYSDGSSQDVTSKSVFSISDAKLGGVSGNIFQSAQQATTQSVTAVENVTATYSELGIPATAEAAVTIQ